MAVLAPPLQVVASGAPPFVQVASGAPPFVAVSGNAPPITIVASGAPPITLFNEDGSLWSAHTPAGGEVLLTGEADGFAADFTHPVDGERVAVKTAGTVVSSGLSFFTNSGTSSKWVYDVTGTLVNVPVGQLAIDYDPVTHAAKGLLVEPAATNRILRSGEFDNASWSKEQVTVTANAAAAPNGLTEADKITEDSSNNVHNTQQTFTLTAAGRASVHGKAAERSNIMLYNTTAGLGDGFNLSTGATFTVAGITTTGSPAIQAVGNGWYRCSIPMPTGASGLGIYLHNGTSYAYTGNGTSGVYVWGAQGETGTATSYIPTTSATVTRVADAVRITPAAINYSATAGSWWADVSLNIFVGDARIIGSTSVYMPMGTTATTVFSFNDLVGAASKTVGSVIGSHKVAIAFQSADRALTADGLAVATNATAGIAMGSPGTYFGIGYGPAHGAEINGYIRKIRYLPRRPSNAELVTMTT